MSTRERDALWLAYRYDKAQKKADYWQAEANRLLTLYNLRMAEADGRLQERLKHLRAINRAASLAGKGAFD